LPLARRFAGSSAIIATKGAIEADDEDSSFSIAAILALGRPGSFYISGDRALPSSERSRPTDCGPASPWTNTAEATAAGALYSDAAAKLAVLVKSTRNAMIGFVVLAYAIYWASQGQAKAVGNKAAFLWQKFPKFVLGFLLISVLATYHFFKQGSGGSARQSFALGVSSHFRWGWLRTNFSEMRKQGCVPSRSERSAKS